LEFADAFLEAHAVPSGIGANVRLALEELLTNTITYGSLPDIEVTITVDLAIADRTITIDVIDDGRAFDPLSRPSADLDGDLDDRPVGGLGIHLVREVMDECRYAREEGRNHLHLRKRLPSAEG